ncbi:DEAD/DEAH box helicase [Leadbettera azotonutricia]|uniref:Cold-shock DEAD box protein A n=1 Tax=Leadbettera azotonutricia (strain ATCC BAA-888 / DSM 13862 / ZAS-9) TaxID=545695 RepID=F5YE00_LEAAZ|nr:DEAD/DEAH box helicase [Leadbettera azotonutricia]AEF80260.1 cold-shock DEAD box protein A [Leadbettera azotonutricia ZAS-9]
MTNDNNSSFSSFGLSDAVLDALSRKGFTAPSSIQTIALPRLLADEGHLIVKARTGTGKTAAFGIPLVERFVRGELTKGHAPRALILTPTRELCLQVSREIASFVPPGTGVPRITAVYGGASIRTQILDLKRGTELVVGTPGRVMDLMERKVLELSSVDWFILDEADEMLDMGFFEDVEKIMTQVKSERRVALFSATMPDPILKIIRKNIGEVEILEDEAPEDEKPAVDQYYLVLKREDRLEVLRRIIDGAEDFYGLIFCATKAGTDELARRLVESGFAAEAIHGDLTQEARERTLRRFRSKQTAILVATDVAARGLDIERLTHVINWDLPNDRETYVHRIGRTGRAGRRGRAISLTLPAERGRMTQLSRSMEKILGSKIQFMKVPTVKAVMKAVRARIVADVCSALPEPEEIETESQSVEPVAEIVAAEIPAKLPTEVAEENSSSPFLGKVCHQLIETLGAEKAVEALISASYGELLDPSRYGTVTEFAEEDFQKGGFGVSRFGGTEGGRKSAYRDKRQGFGSGRSPGREGRPPVHEGRPQRHEGARRDSPDALSDASARVYVGLGRQHGAGAKEVANLLMKAGGVPGRLVDAIEMKDFCAFASLPAEAARKACAFSRNAPNDPPIRLASPRN